MSNLNRLRYASSAGRSRKRSPASNSSTNGQHRLSNVKTKRLAVLEKPQRCKPEAVNVFLYGVASRNHAFFVLKIYGDEMQWVQP